MPRRRSKPCAFPLCPALTEERFCEKHKQGTSAIFKKGEREAHDGFYHKAQWRELRRWFIRRNPLCVECGAPGYVVDHIKPISQGGHPTDLENLQTMCESCHNRKRQKEKKS